MNRSDPLMDLKTGKIPSPPRIICELPNQSGGVHVHSGPVPSQPIRLRGESEKKKSKKEKVKKVNRRAPLSLFPVPMYIIRLVNRFTSHFFPPPALPRLSLIP